MLIDAPCHLRALSRQRKAFGHTKRRLSDLPSQENVSTAEETTTVGLCQRFSVSSRCSD